MNEINKKIVDGKVAVLYSPGFGAGWSTWGYSDRVSKEFMIFDASLVIMKELDASAEDVAAYIDRKFGAETGVYLAGWEKTRIEWLPVGTRFHITEHDGNESIHCFDDEDILTA